MARAAAPLGASLVYDLGPAGKGYDLVVGVLASLCLASTISLVLDDREGNLEQIAPAAM